MSNKIFGRDFYFFLELIKWLCVILLLVVASVGSYFFRNSNLFYRLVAVFFVVVCSGYIALLTNYGKLLISLFKEAYNEVRRVIWPTFRECLYVTIIVIFVIIVMALILWGLDSMLVCMVSLGLRM